MKVSKESFLGSLLAKDLVDLDLSGEEVCKNGACFGVSAISPEQMARSLRAKSFRSLSSLSPPI